MVWVHSPGLKPCHFEGVAVLKIAQLPEETMKVTVEIPSALRRFTDGAGRIECEGANLPGVLESLGTKHPAITQHLRDESGQVRRFINIYVNDEDVRFLGGDAYQFRDGDQVLIVPSIAGG
jgi:molybdopterin synthase sulfur carrier subunit